MEYLYKEEVKENESCQHMVENLNSELQSEV
jgi:hypothetical protein